MQVSCQMCYKSQEHTKNSVFIIIPLCRRYKLLQFLTASFVASSICTQTSSLLQETEKEALELVFRIGILTGHIQENGNLMMGAWDTASQ